MDLKEWAVNISIAFIILALLVGGVAGPLARDALTNLATVAENINYTATKAAATQAANYVDKAIYITAIVTALLPILSMFSGRRKDLKDVPQKIVGFSVGLLVVSILVFSIALPQLVVSKLLADSLMAMVVKIIPISLVLSAIGIFGLLEMKGEETAEIKII